MPNSNNRCETKKKKKGAKRPRLVQERASVWLTSGVSGNGGWLVENLVKLEAGSSHRLGKCKSIRLKYMEASD